MASDPSQTKSRQRGEAATPYVDGFVIAVPRDRIDDYERIACDAAPSGGAWRAGRRRVRRRRRAYGELTSFPRAVQASDEETVIFSWIAYESRETRDEVNAKVMADPRIQEAMAEVPFDPKRMIYGGFRTLVEL